MAPVQLGEVKVSIFVCVTLDTAIDQALEGTAYYETSGLIWRVDIASLPMTLEHLDGNQTHYPVQYLANHRVRLS